MADSPALQGEIRRLFAEKSVFLLTTHTRADGDAVGSMLGLAQALEETGKKVQRVIADGIPSIFRFLPGSEKVMRKAESGSNCTVVLDCSDMQRTGGVISQLYQADLCIDHHITNMRFARLNLVLPDVVATSAMVADRLEDWGLPFSTTTASILLFGVISDSLGFRTNNTTSASLRTAAMLVDRGAPLQELYKQALLTRTFQAAKYWALGLESLRLDGEVVWTHLTLEDRIRASYSGGDDADLINMLSTIDNTKIAVIFVEQKDKKVKVSWRSQNGVDVSQIALKFGGGGHPSAAGAEIHGSLEDVEREVLKETQRIINPDVY